MSSIPETVNSETLSREVDACEHALGAVECKIAELEARGERVPPELYEQCARDRERITEVRERIQDLTAIERLKQRLLRSREPKVRAIPVGHAAFAPGRDRSGFAARAVE